MIIVGAKGFAKEVLEIFSKVNLEDNLAFFDDIDSDLLILYNKFPVLKSLSEVEAYFKKFGKQFSIAIGNPHLRRKLHEKFIRIGGDYTSTISKNAVIGSYNVKISAGCNVLDNSILSNDTTLGIGCIVYYNVTITHDCKIGDFVELSPGATVLGGCEIGENSQIGSNSTILPKVKIGKNVIIGAGSVVTKDVPDNCVIVGVPGRIIKKVELDS